MAKKISDYEKPKKQDEEMEGMEDFDMPMEREEEDEMSEESPLADFSTEELLAEIESRGEMDKLEGGEEDLGEFEDEEEDDEFFA